MATGSSGLAGAMLAIRSVPPCLMLAPLPVLPPTPVSAEPVPLLPPPQAATTDARVVSDRPSTVPRRTKSRRVRRPLA